ncbi:unnamed protein product [Somion occarium]|uniref:F-box domain-containing protein n=1 Tax=Somion occarium TaxID=3059160 RepID=A0ABP1DTM2_9APHY
MDRGFSLRVPQEIIDYVIDFLHDDKPSLCCCALLSWAWLESSRYHLFGIIRIRIGQSANVENHLTSFTLFFNSRQTIAMLVRSLSITRGEWDRLAAYPEIELYLIAALLRSLPRLSMFSMDHVGLLWNSRTSEMTGSHRPSFRLQELRAGTHAGPYTDGATFASSVSPDALHTVRATRVEVLMTDHKLLRLLYATIAPSNLTSCLLTVNRVADAIDVQSVLNGTASRITTLELSFVEFVPIGLILRNGFEDCVTIDLDLCRSLETLHLGLTIYQDHDLMNAFLWASIFSTVATLRSSISRLEIDVCLHWDISKPLAVLQHLDWSRLANALQGINTKSIIICLFDRPAENASHRSPNEIRAFIGQMLSEYRDSGVLSVRYETVPWEPVEW